MAGRLRLPLIRISAMLTSSFLKKRNFDDPRERARIFHRCHAGTPTTYRVAGDVQLHLDRNSGEQEARMAKEQKRGNRETKKPKKPEAVAAPVAIKGLSASSAFQKKKT